MWFFLLEYRIMMTLPHFTDPIPSINNLWQEQARLKNQANKLINKTNILGLFAKYGELSSIGGSYEYNLMVYPDLDIGVVAPSVKKDDFASLVGELTASEYVRKIGTADTVNFEPVHPGRRPKGYWIGLEVPFEEDRWGIDCWVQQPEWVSDSEDTYAGRLLVLEQPGQDAILLIKYDLIRRGVYGKTVFSVDVYDAVLNEDVRTVTEFNKLHGIAN